MPDMKTPCKNARSKRFATFDSLATEFQRLSDRFEDAGRQSTKPSHLSGNVGENAVRAGRLLIEAIDAGAFPESLSEQNGAWWHRASGRLPGGAFMLLPSGFRWQKGQPPPDSGPEAVAAASKPLDPEQLAICWMFAIGSWLAKQFPSRFRLNAAEKDWAHTVLDIESGRPVDSDGRLLRGRWFKDGKPLPYDFEWTSDLKDGKYAWKLEGEPASEHDSYDEADWLDLLRARAEVYADACRLLAELVVGTTAPPGSHVAGFERPVKVVDAAGIINVRSDLVLNRLRRADCKTTPKRTRPAYAEHDDLCKLFPRYRKHWAD